MESLTCPSAVDASCLEISTVESTGDLRLPETVGNLKALLSPGTSEDSGGENWGGG